MYIAPQDETFSRLFPNMKYDAELEGAVRLSRQNSRILIFGWRCPTGGDSISQRDSGAASNKGHNGGAGKTA